MAKRSKSRIENNVAFVSNVNLLNYLRFEITRLRYENYLKEIELKDREIELLKKEVELSKISTSATNATNTDAIASHEKLIKSDILVQTKVTIGPNKINVDADSEDENGCGICDNDATSKFILAEIDKRNDARKYKLLTKVRNCTANYELYNLKQCPIKMKIKLKNNGNKIYNQTEGRINELQDKGFNGNNTFVHQYKVDDMIVVKKTPFRASTKLKNHFLVSRKFKKK